jgi:hypothetical protein
VTIAVASLPSSNGPFLGPVCSYAPSTTTIPKSSIIRPVPILVPRGRSLMRAFISLSAWALCFLLYATPSPAQVELYGGYSLVRADVTYSQTTGTCALPCIPVSVGTHLNLQGWEASGAVKILGPLSGKADFDGTFGSFHGAHTHLQTYLFGPQIRFPAPVSPFAHFLVGAAHEAIGNGVSGGTFTTGPTQNAFATAVGGGIDIKAFPFISVRLIQFDYLLTRFNSSNQHQPRVSAGLVLRF